MKFVKVTDLNENSQIKLVLLNRPEVKNAFHPEMISELTEVFRSLAKENLKSIVLKGEGSVFCSGADLNWMKEMIKYSFDQNKKDSEKLWDMFQSIIECECPVIGLLHGAVYGGALGLAACCDYVIAEKNTQFCFSEVKLGLAPAVISSFVLRKISDSFARAFMLSAEVFSAEAALRIGLVHEIKEEQNFHKEDLKKFLSNGLEAMRETKKLLNTFILKPEWSAQKHLTTQVISERRVSHEAQERLKKFIEKK